MLALVVLMIVFCAEGLLEMFDALGGAALGTDLLLAAKLFAKATSDRGDGIGLRVAGDRAEAIEKAVAWLKRGVSLPAGHEAL